MKVRIGIDVGGTFTDAVAINHETFNLIGSIKVPTSHKSEHGVAEGIVEVLQKLMCEYDIKAEDVAFIAHGTTQATNALLEGDVAKVGIITLGSGLEGLKSRNDTKIGDIELAPGKKLQTSNVFINVGKNNNLIGDAESALKELKEQDAKSIVITEAFSVDHPENENLVLDVCRKKEIPGTAGNDVSKLYGLKVRTRTAVINGSILPKMLEAANMTEKSIKESGISVPLMVMRCDGGVMTVEEVRNRPILTILSGPAAGVAGALMYEKLTDGIFFEVGGTSTDISCIKDGNVIVKYAEVGGHKTYLNSLDVRTVGIGGGSMIEVNNGKAVNVGPRSAHIADLDYEVYAKSSDIVNPVLKEIRPMDGDPSYAYIECSNGMRFSLTLSGAANIAEYVGSEHYAFGNRDAAIKAWKPLADNMGISVEEAARKILELSAMKNGRVVKEMISDYKLDPETLVFVGGGGGASVVVPHIAEIFGCSHRIAKNAAVISPIGVALAMVRDMVERSVANPGEKDVLAIRQEAIKKAVAAGANPETIEVKIEIDSQQQKLRAIAIGTTELRSKELLSDLKTDEELLKIVAENLAVTEDRLKIEADNGSLSAVTCELEKKLFLVFKRKVNTLRLIDREGVIRLQKKNATVLQSLVENWKQNVQKLLEDHTIYGDGGAEIPNIYIALGKRIISLDGMSTHKQILSLCEVELSGVPADELLILICTLTTENDR